MALFVGFLLISVLSVLSEDIFGVPRSDLPSWFNPDVDVDALAAEAGGLGGCPKDCWDNCLSHCEAECDKNSTCLSFTMAYAAGSVVKWQCHFNTCNHTVGWNSVTYVKSKPGTYEQVPGVAMVRCSPVPPPYTCPQPPSFTCNETTWYKQPRHNTAWIPGTNIPDKEINSAFRNHPKAYDSVSTQWAWVNSKWNAKCNNATEGLCGRFWTQSQLSVLNTAKTLGYRNLPMLQVCGVCVLNQSWDFHPQIDMLVADAKQYGFDGYVLDMELGGWYNQTGRISFLDYFEAQLKKEVGPHAELDWFSHWRWWPDGSFPNSADYVFCMDTYGQTNLAGYWVGTYKCQSGVGLAYPGDFGTPAHAESWFKNWNAHQALRAIGTWGIVKDDGSNMSKTWYTEMENFLKS